MLNKVRDVLIKLRVVSTALIFFICIVIWNMWVFYKDNHLLMELSSGGAFSLAWIALIGLLGKCLNHLLEGNKKDEQ